jgi:APA family basic amino acid/polyamine antiporter
MTSPSPAEPATLVRGLGLWDAALLTSGNMLGTSVFIAAALVPRALPHPTLVLLAWVSGGLLTLAGALSYAELGAMFPKAGGQYHFLKEAFGPLSGFLFGWTSFLVAQSAAIAYIAVAFGEYLGAFFPSISTTHILLAVPIGRLAWKVNAVQVVGALAIVALTAVNCFGLKAGAAVQNGLTVLKLATVVVFCVIGLTVPAAATPDWTAPLPAGNLAVGLGVALVGIFAAYDGWYVTTLSAGEIRDPHRNLPRGMIAGVLAIIVLYTLLNLVYVRALSLSSLAATPRIGESAATALLGSAGGRLMALAVLISVFGGLSSTILSVLRIPVIVIAQSGMVII